MAKTVLSALKDVLVDDLGEGRPTEIPGICRLSLRLIPEGRRRNHGNLSLDLKPENQSPRFRVKARMRKVLERAVNQQLGVEESNTVDLSSL